MLLVANLANTKWCEKHENWLKPWQMGTHLRVLSESFLMITNMAWFRGFSKYLRLCALDESSLSIGRVKGSQLWFSSQGSKAMLHVYAHGRLFQKRLYFILKKAGNLFPKKNACFALYRAGSYIFGTICLSEKHLKMII